MIAAETGARTAIIVQAGTRDQPGVQRYGPLTVIRLPGRRTRGTAARYLVEYLDFLIRARRLIAGDPRLRRAKIIHVHTLPDFLVAAALPAKRRGARIILDLHELFPEFTRSRFAGLAGRMGERIASALERWSRRRADVVVTVNTAVAQQLRRRSVRSDERIAVVHNFAEPAEFGPIREPAGRASGPIRLVYHGTLTPLYGLDLAVDAVARATRQGIRVTFDIYGDGPSRGELERQVKALGLSNEVRLPGSIPHQALREVLTGYDAGFVPTRLDGMTRFSLSTKLLEYIHLGVPVIIPEIPTYHEYFPGDTAWYFTPNDADAAASALAAFARATPAERVTRARTAQQCMIQKLDAARDAGLLRTIYSELGAMSGSRPRHTQRP